MPKFGCHVRLHPNDFLYIGRKVLLGYSGEQSKVVRSLLNPKYIPYMYIHMNMHMYINTCCIHNTYTNRGSDLTRMSLLQQSKAGCTWRSLGDREGHGRGRGSLLESVSRDTARKPFYMQHGVHSAHSTWSLLLTLTKWGHCPMETPGRN